MITGIKINEQLKNEYYQKGYWSTATVYDYFKVAADKYPERIAVVDKNERWTYLDVAEKVQKAANGLHSLGVKRGDFVSIQLPNWAEYLVLYLATNKLGAIFNPIPITARHQEVKHMLFLCESKVYFITPKFRSFDFFGMAKQLEEEVDIAHIVVVNKDQETVGSQTHGWMTYETFINIKQQKMLDDQNSLIADDPVAVVFTSGTESLPKGVIHSHNTILFGERSMIQTLSISENDAMLMPSPLSHATGFLHGMNLPFLVGAKSVLMEHFTAEEALKMIEREKCTFTMGASPFLHDVLRELSNTSSYDISHFRFFLCGGAPIPRHMVTEAREKGFKVLAVYGASESPPHTVSRLNDTGEKVSSSDGKPLKGIEVKIVDDERRTLPQGEVGEEASRGPNVFLGYLKNPELTDRYIDEEGWYYGGDLCLLQEDGYVQVVGRKKDMIIRGGLNVSPREIEELLLRHPKVEKVAIVGIPDDRLGERACAFVITQTGEAFSFEEMIEFLMTQNIAKYKYPERLEVVEHMPTTASGKIQKYILRKKLVKA